MNREPKSRLDHMKAMVDLRPEDETLLAEVGKRIRPRLGEIVDGFIDRLRPLQSGALPVFDEEWEEQAREAQRAYLELLLGGVYDEDFLERRMRIASMLGSLRPPSRWFPGGYSVYVEHIPLLVQEFYGDEPEKSLRVHKAIEKIFLFDLQIICHSCLGQSVESVQEQRDRLRAIVSDRTRRLRVTEERYQDLFESYPEMILAMNEGGLIVDINRAALDSLGYERREMEQLTIHHLVADSHHPRFRMHLERMIRTGHDRLEAHIITRGGAEKHVELVSTAVRDEDGRYLGARVFLRDLTARKRLEEEMIRWERLVAVGSMAAKVAHEIRNPLSSISLNVELLQDEVQRLAGAESEEATALVASILSEIDRLTNVIEEYLTFGRLPSPSLEAVPTESFLRSVAEFVRPDMEEHNIELEIEVRPDTPDLMADKNQVRQSILNLFRNSQEAMPSGGTIRVIAGCREGQVILEVRDTGVGIPKEEIRKIFDPFYTTKDYGTGLGLAFVQQVMREHGGRVSCRSEDGSGTSFRLLFPAAKE
ncbi:MAG: ATP-binding protein [Candidatus Eisenbacteria bacterium]